MPSLTLPSIPLLSALVVSVHDHIHLFNFIFWIVTLLVLYGKQPCIKQTDHSVAVETTTGKKTPWSKIQITRTPRLWHAREPNLRLLSKPAAHLQKARQNYACMVCCKGVYPFIGRTNNLGLQEAWTNTTKASGRFVSHMTMAIATGIL